MCLSIPKQVVQLEDGSDFAWVERHGKRERINMMLLGEQPLGTWVLTSMGLAKEVVDPGQLVQIEEALSALAASLDGDYDASRFFKDLERP